MTGHQINSLVGDLVAMAQAMERLPHAEQELADAHRDVQSKIDTIQRLEAKLLDRANEIAELQAKLRKSEEDRDNAETMFLESEDKLGRVLNLVRGMGETLGQAVVDVKAMAEPKGQSANPPSAFTPEPVSNAVGSQAPIDAGAPIVGGGLTEPSPSPEPEVSPANPTAPSGDGDGPSPATATPIPSVEHSADASSRFKGKNWSEVPWTERPDTHAEWVAGGGSEEGWSR